MSFYKRSYKHIEQTSKKIQMRLTEHQKAINKHDHSSLPAKHADNNGDKFDWSQTRCLGQATIKHACEFKEALHSMDELTFHRHIDISTIYLQLKRPRKSSTLSPLTFNPPTTSLPTSTDDDNNYLCTIATNDNHRHEIPQTIKRSHRLQHCQQEHENSNILTF